MRIVLIGAGRLATQLGKALYKSGHDIMQVYSRTSSSAQKLATELGATPITDAVNLSSSAEVYIMAVTDSAIAEMIPIVCKGREQQVFLHTAGSIPMDAFKGMALHYGVLYPVQTFSKERSVDFHSIPCLIEANDEYTANIATSLATSVSQYVMQADSEQRKYVHLAAVFACNFANHCYALAAEVLAKEGIAFDILLPLIEETAQKVKEMSPVEAQTGPAVRYDENVIREQSKLLSCSPLMKDIYERMSMSIHQKSRSK